MKETFEKSLRSGRPVLAAFISAGKDDAAMAAEAIAGVRDKLGDKFEYVTIDCAFHSELRKKYKIDNYPTFILFVGEKEMWRGNTHKPEVIVESINSFV